MMSKCLVFENNFVLLSSRSPLVYMHSYGNGSCKLITHFKKKNNTLVPYLNYKSRNALIKNMHGFSRIYIKRSSPSV